MTQLSLHTFAHLTGSSFRLKAKLLPNKNILDLNPIPTGLGHMTLIYGLIPPMAGRNRVNQATLESRIDAEQRYFA